MNETVEIIEEKESEDKTLPKEKAVSKASGSSSVVQTPMMLQYLAIKKEHEDCLLFYRMGDFYEMFFKDAEDASKTLNIALTKRGSHSGEPIPMCGVPVHAAENYLHKLTEKGYRIAICDQMENPAEAKKRGHKAVVRREVTRIVTQGTLCEDNLLDHKSNNFLLAIGFVQNTLACAWVDMSTGALFTQLLKTADPSHVLSRIAPREILVPQTLFDQAEFRQSMRMWDTILFPIADSQFDSVNGETRIAQVFKVDSPRVFGDFARSELSALGALINYLDLTQKGRMPLLATPHRVTNDQLLIMDSATMRNLEILSTLEGKRKGSLLSTIDLTVTAGGARLLTQRLAAPSTDISVINQRLDNISLFIHQPQIREELRDLLKSVTDLERALSRLSLRRGGPRDLAAIGLGLKIAIQIRHKLRNVSAENVQIPADITAAVQKLEGLEAIADQLNSALRDELPLHAREGNFICRGYAPELDQVCLLRDESRRLILNLEQEYRELTKIDNLKIKHNNVLGWFIEITIRHVDQIETANQDGEFFHRQTMSNAARYSSNKLNVLAREIAEAMEKSLAMELDIFENLVQMVLNENGRVMGAAHALAILDWATSLAELSVRKNYARPVLLDDCSFNIEAGRHPVVEQALDQSGDNFTANDCALGDTSRLWLLTGPNMAGKSTFLRQNALITIMAQSGCYVPAKSCSIGVIDRLFSRVGASDDLARGHSTFMVEMMETATILRQSTNKSLVILDEIGRGTATFDGLSIAWATVEYLHDRIGCRALFATHYHELVSLKARLSGLAPYSMAVKEWQGEVIFLHQIKEGAADRSYGIHVAKLAGLPESVVGRAREILEKLEQGERSKTLEQLSDDLPLFAQPSLNNQQGGGDVIPEGLLSSLSRLEDEVAKVNPDQLTPMKALEILYKLKTLEGDIKKERNS